jgi:hypothetical protein
MNNKRPQLVNDEVYHVVIRAVGDTVVFDDEKDFYRGIFSIYEFNTSKYVYANLISLLEPGWKEKGIENSEKVKEFLENNKRHSYPDYLGKNNFPSVTQREFLLGVMGGREGFKTEVDNWIMYKKELKDLGDIVLE